MNRHVLSYSSGVRPVNGNDENINRLIIAACKLNSLSPALIEPYIPRRTGLRNTFAFQYLLNINVNPRLTKTAYANMFNTCRHSTCHVIDYLKELGLVYELGKPRLIKPFQRFKVDTAYNITTKGSKVITGVLKVAGI
ncbi:hypothetical protein [uncultured Mucilaginibacter sp.]|jgi:hypothetical protein|uniref:hypothetical protein n=1 Tax=uncultured Mucilaginibacter sp. TaxID=797541 RepID=UPI0025F297C7|nr:hypothetical protein [uncultured Mucilaginibacter sp.]